MLVDKRKEVLRLYREILRTARQFEWPNEQGQPWSLVLRKNVRMEIEQHRHETDGEAVSRLILRGWDSLGQIQDKMIEKQRELQRQAAAHKDGSDPNNKPST